MPEQTASFEMERNRLFPVLGSSLQAQQREPLKVEGWATNIIEPRIAKSTEFMAGIKSGFEKEEQLLPFLALMEQIADRGVEAREKLLYAYYCSTTKTSEVEAEKLARLGSEWLTLTFELFGGKIAEGDFRKLNKLVKNTRLSSEDQKEMSGWLKEVYDQRNLLSGGDNQIKEGIMALRMKAAGDEHGGGVDSGAPDASGAGKPPKKDGWFKKQVTDPITGSLRRLFTRMILNKSMGRFFRALGLGPEALKDFGLDTGALLLRVALTLGTSLLMYKLISPVQRVEAWIAPWLVPSAESTQTTQAIIQAYGEDQLSNYQTASRFFEDVLNGGNTMISVKEHLVNIADFNNPKAKELFLVTVDAYRFELDNAGLKNRQAIYDYAVGKGYSDTEANYLADVGKEILDTRTGGDFKEYQDVFDKAGSWTGSLNSIKSMVSVSPPKPWEGNRYRGSKPIVTSKKPGQWF